MEKIEFWKNFSLGTELEISGAFIYNALKLINNIENFNYSEDVFEILYNLSVGIERIEKIAIILIEHKDIDNQKEFEKKIISHNHQELLKRITKNNSLQLNKPEIEFITLLSIFYKKNRYDRFNLDTKNQYDKEKELFIDFIKSRLNVEVDNDSSYESFKNTQQIQSFLSKIVGKISSEIFNVIECIAREQNIYTYELRLDGKAYNVFINKDYIFNYETILKKEFIISIINNSNSNFIKFIKSIQPLCFDVQDENEMISNLLATNKSNHYFDELDNLYENIINKNDRFKKLELIGKTGISF